jgi:hypothetical protein
MPQNGDVVCQDLLGGSWQKLSPFVLVVSMVGLNTHRTSYVNGVPRPSDCQSQMAQSELERCVWVHFTQDIWIFWCHHSFIFKYQSI